MSLLSNEVSVDLLRPHPKNAEYFSDPTPEEYEQLKQSIAENGIRDPLKVLPDYTVVAGSMRLRAAKELGLTHVPVEIWDVPPEEAEYLLIADNEERRVCQDPIRKAKRAEFLKKYWDVRQGKKPQNAVESSGKTIEDIAEAVGESVDSVQRLLKLNDLIPPLQNLVSQGRLSQTAAYSLAFLPPEEQQALLDTLGESGICGLSVKKAQELRNQLDSERKRSAEIEGHLKNLEKELAGMRKESEEAKSLKAELARLLKENEALKARKPEIVEKVVEKVVYKPDPAKDKEIERLRKEVERLQGELQKKGADEDTEKLLDLKRKELQQLEAERSILEDYLQKKRNEVALLNILRKLFLPLEKERDEVYERLMTSEVKPIGRAEIRRWTSLLEWYAEKLKQALPPAEDGTVIEITDYRGGRK